MIRLHQCGFSFISDEHTEEDSTYILYWTQALLYPVVLESRADLWPYLDALHRTSERDA